MTATAVVVLAAGQGKRMHSDLPKVLHPFADSTLIDFVLDSVAALSPARTVVVIGHQADRVRAALQGRPLKFALQAEQLGTGHAVQQCEEALAGFAGTVLVLVGDVPLLRTSTLSTMLRSHLESGCACTVLTAEFADPSGYGRIVRASDGTLEAIVEHKDATSSQLAIREINSGILAFDSRVLWEFIHRLSRGNSQSEYYLTDLVGLLRTSGLRVCAFCVDDPWEVTGINSPEQRSELERIFLERRSRE